MARADGVIAVSFEDFDSAFFRARYAGSTERTIVVVNASALEFGGFAVYAQALCRIHFDFAYADVEDSGVGEFVAVFDENFSAIETRIGG